MQPAQCGLCTMHMGNTLCAWRIDAAARAVGAEQWLQDYKSGGIGDMLIQSHSPQPHSMRCAMKCTQRLKNRSCIVPQPKRLTSTDWLVFATLKNAPQAILCQHCKQMSAARTAAHPNVFTLTWQLIIAFHMSSKVSVSRLVSCCMTCIASTR